MDRFERALKGHRRGSWAWWREKLVELLLAVIVAYMVVQVSLLIGARNKNLLPASAWFQVNDIFVPDHTTGTNPTMIYDRSVREDFKGFWIVEVQQVRTDGLFSHACGGFGTSLYSTDEVIEKNEVTWDWFIGRPCAVAPGHYRLRVSYAMRRTGWPEKELTAISNVFTVHPRAEAPAAVAAPPDR